MRAITVMYDSLNRKYLPNYGDNLSIMPNFRRLAKKTVTFDNFYVGSLPCIPARRELHTGRYNFYIDVGDRWNLLMILLHPYWEKMEYILIA